VLTVLLQRARMMLRKSPLKRHLDAMGLTSVSRRYYENGVLKRGELPATIFGERFVFCVSSRHEITELDGFAADQTEGLFITRLLESLKPGDVFYDVGANVGVVSMLAARRANAGAAGQGGVEIHAFEPEPRNFAQLSKNLEKNAVRRVRPHKLALGATTGTATLFVAGEVGSGFHSLVPGANAENVKVEIEIDTAANVAARLGHPPTVIKIDVEGAETDVIAGLIPLLDRGSPRELFIEVHPPKIEAAGKSTEDVTRPLLSRGYELVWSSKRGKQWHEHYVRAASAPGGASGSTTA
jgi:FkbM family methyltransferase